MPRPKVRVLPEAQFAAHPPRLWRYWRAPLASTSSSGILQNIFHAGETYFETDLFKAVDRSETGHRGSRQGAAFVGPGGRDDPRRQCRIGARITHEAFGVNSHSPLQRGEMDCGHDSLGDGADMATKRGHRGCDFVTAFRRGLRRLPSPPSPLPPARERVSRRAGRDRGPFPPQGLRRGLRYFAPSGLPSLHSAQPDLSQRTSDSGH